MCSGTAAVGCSAAASVARPNASYTRFEWAGMGAGARALLTKRAVGYGLVGKVILDTPLGDQTVELKGKGNVPLRKLVR